MKARRGVKKAGRFTPVILRLESQAEVDGVYSLLNHSQLRFAVGFKGPVSHALTRYKSENTGPLHSELCKLTKYA